MPAARGRFLRRCVFAAIFAVTALSTSVARSENIYRTVTIAWDASASTDVTGYRVHYGTQSGSYLHLIEVGPTLSAEIPNLVDGTTYFFAITSFNAAGVESGYSEEFVHTVDPGVLMSISARADVETDENVLIAGFSVGGSSRKTIIVRALGPTLATYGVARPLANPQLEIFGPGGILVGNDDWQTGTPAELIAHGLAPAFDAEAAVAITLPPGSYTAIVRGSGGTTGVALVEVYDAGIPAQ